MFISGGLTHASFGGIGLGLYTGISPILAAGVFAVLSAFGVEWLSKRNDMREDSAIAVFWTLGMALGIMFTFLSPGFAPDLSAYLFGNILTITFGDIALLAGLAVILAIFFILYLRPIIYVAFDREFARSQGIPVQIFEYVLMMFIALTIVACLRMVGIVLVISLLTIPQMTANLFTHRFHRIIWLSIGIGYLSCLGGLMISYYLNVPSGAAIIFFSIIIYVVCKLGKSTAENAEPVKLTGIVETQSNPPHWHLSHFDARCRMFYPKEYSRHTLLSCPNHPLQRLLQRKRSL